MKDNPTFVLVHGSWHDGGSWSAVGGNLRDAGFPVVVPTLPGHGLDVDRVKVTHDDYVQEVVRSFESVDAPVVLVGHSFGGSVISRVAELHPERCRLLIYYSAFVPRDGECVADSLPEPFIAFLEDAATSSADRSVILPNELFDGAFANTADPATAAVLYGTLVPEPSGPVFEPLRLPSFDRLGIASAYISCLRDRALPPGSFHPGQSSRLCNPQLLEIDADHEALLTAPERLAWALLKAAGADELRLAAA